MLRPLALAALFCSLAAASARAQSSASPDSSVCLGFSFGSWTPKLDWRAAGHGAAPDTSHIGHAAGGRGWAIDTKGARDSILVLFPGWWPAGVSIEIPNRAPAPGDTLLGKATAYIAYGDRTAPTAKVRAWRVRCGGS